MFHYREVSRENGEVAVEVTQQRSDGLYVIGYLDYIDGFWYAFSPARELYCDLDDALPARFTSHEQAAQALAAPLGYHLMPRYP